MADSADPNDTPVPTIVKPKQRNYRKRKLDEDNEPELASEDGHVAQSVRFERRSFFPFFHDQKGESLNSLFSLFRETLEEAKMEQKLRKREGGVTPEDLLKPLAGVKRNQAPVAEEDPYKLKTGGLVEMKK